MDPIADPVPVVVDVTETLRGDDLLEAVHRTIPKVPYFNMGASSATCFDELETKEWFGLVWWGKLSVLV
jgi:hypothetical protein